MKKYCSFENLECWRQARDLAVEIHRFSSEENLNGDHIISEQLCRSAISVMSNIAEGKTRGSDQDFIKHLQNAKAAAAALHSNLIISREIGYLAEGDFIDYQDRANRISALIGGLINAITKNNEGKKKTGVCP